MFSRQQLNKLHDIHELMAQNLRRTAARPMETHVLEQMKLREALEDVRGGELYRVRSSWADRRDSEVSSGREPDHRHFTQLSGAPRKVDPETGTRLDELSRRMDHAYALDDALIFAGAGIARCSETDSLLGAFRNAWKTQARVPALDIETASLEDVAADSLRIDRMVLYARIGPPEAKLMDIDWISRLPPDDRGLLHRLLRSRGVRRNRYVFYQHDEAHDGHLVVAGTVRLVKWRSDDSMVALSDSGPGSWIGAAECLARRTYLCNASTETQVVVATVGVSEFDRLMASATVWMPSLSCRGRISETRVK